MNNTLYTQLLRTSYDKAFKNAVDRAFANYIIWLSEVGSGGEPLGTKPPAERFDLEIKRILECHDHAVSSLP